MIERVLRFLQYICRFNFGVFEKEEFKKFLRMGMFFALIIGVYWTLRPLKDAVFIHLVGRLMLPYAKTISLCGMLPLVMLYTKLLERTSKERMFVIVPAFYGCTMLCFAGLMLVAQAPAEQIAARGFFASMATQALGYLFYLFVESFGSLVTASLFWSFASDTTDPVSAKRGFPFVYTLGQIGGVLCPYSIGGLPHRLGCSTDALSLLCLGVLTLLIIPTVKYFLRATPRHLLVSFQGNCLEQAPKKETGFFEGLKLLTRHRYLLGIFAVNFIFEVVVTIFDFNFKQLYIPTTSDVRFKAQAWIETFGSRASKEAGSVFNMLLAPLQGALGSTVGRAYYVSLCGCVGFPLLGLWLVTALFLGRQYNRAVEKEVAVC